LNFFLLLMLNCIFITSLFSSSLTLTQEEQSYLKQKKVLRVQNLDTFPPFNFYENGQPKGYTIDYMKLIAKILDIKIDFISGKTWNESLLMLKKGELDIIPQIVDTKERQKFIAFTSFTHIEYILGVAVHKNESISSVKDLEKKILAVSQNSFLHKHFEKQFPRQKLILTGSSLEALDTLVEGKSDAVIGSLPALNYYIQKNWLSNIKIIKLNNLKLPSKTKMKMGVSIDNKILKSILEKAYNQVSLTQEVELKKKWIDSEVDTGNLNTLEKKEKKYLENKKEIKMCIDPDWMPFEKNDNGKHIGMTSEYMQYFEKILDVPIIMVPTKSWSESLSYGQERKCDIFSLVMPTPERRKYLDFTKPYMSVPLIIATKLEQPFINNIGSIINKPIAVVKGYAYIELLKIKYPSIKLVTVENLNEGLEKVLKGTIFGFIGALPTVGYSIQEKYIGELKIAGKFDETWDLGIGVRNDEPILKDIFQKAINSVSEQKKQDILNKWIAVKFHNVMNYNYLWKASLLFIIILLIILYKNRTMNAFNKKLSQANKDIKEQQQMVNRYVLILTTDLNAKITSVNEAYSKAIGYKSEELVGKSHKLIHHPEMKNSTFTDMWENIKNDKTWVGEVKNIKKDKSEIILNMYVEPIFKDQEKIGYRTICEDITDKKRIEILSITDTLTGLYNRLKIDEVILKKTEAFKRYGTVFSIILIDIDDFKIVNDTYGHDIGDYVLQEIAAILKSNVRITDVVGRWGGEEFLVICESTGLENTYILADNLRKTVENHAFKNIKSMSISLGISEFKEDDSLVTLFKRTDDALYKAKKAGKNCVVKGIQ